MKKLLLWMMLLSVVSTSYSQETFVRKYKYMIITKNNISELSKDVNLIVVFNNNNEKEIKFHFESGEITEYYQVSDLTEGKTESGEEYQLIEIVSKEKGNQIMLQLFDRVGALRLVFSKGNTIEFYQ